MSEVTFKQVVRELMKLEGKKRQVNVAQMSETVLCFGILLIQKPYAIAPIMVAAMNRLLEPLAEKKKAKGKRK